MLFALKDNSDYDVLKALVLRAYELILEAYRQKFRHHKKSSIKTYVEFAREKESLFDRRCAAGTVTDQSALYELMLLEDFKNCLPDRLVVYLNEQQGMSPARAAVLLDKFILTNCFFLTTPREQEGG